MKFIKSLIFPIACLLYSCTQIDAPEQIEKSGAENFGEISINEAVDLALKATIIGETKNSRTPHSRTVSNRFKQVIKHTNNDSRGVNTGAYYIVSFDNDEGFAIISATSLSNPIIGFIPDGKYEDYKQNANFNYAVANAIGLPTNPIDTLKENIMLSSKIDTIFVDKPQVGPYVSVKWTQNGIFGKYFKNGLSGCANTAITQAMTYYEYPPSITLTHDNNRILNLDWSKIKSEPKHFFCSCDSETHEMISRLLRECGFRSHSNDSKSGGTGTSPAMAKSAAESFGYTCIATGTELYPQPTLSYEKLNEKELYLVYGYDSDDTYNRNGHMWLCDGAVSIGYILKCYICEGYNELSGEPIWKLYSIDNHVSNYFHHNWGYGNEGGWLIGGSYVDSSSGIDFGHNVNSFLMYRE